MITTIIFDLDGTLLNTIEDLKDSVNFVLKAHGHPTKTSKEIKNFVGNGVKKLIELAIPDDKNNILFEEYLIMFREHYSKNMYNKTHPYEGIENMLAELNKNNFKIAVVSNKFDSAVKELCERYFNGSILTAIGESESIKRKPAPDSILEAIKLLDSKKEEVLYVGDSEVDVRTAKNAGVVSAGVTWGFRTHEVLLNEGVDYIIETPNDLLELIKKLNEEANG